MLTTLTVKNFAIIDNISVDFKKGLTVLTGETGTGKSLIIDAIGLLLGDRASVSMIRKGASKAIIEGIFQTNNKNVLTKLDEYGIEVDDNDVIIRREINENGKSIIRINGIIVTLAQLDEISKYFADIHTQNDTKKLFDVANYVEFIDNDNTSQSLIDYQNCLETYKNDLKKYTDLKKNAEDAAANYDFLQYRLKELKNASLKPTELANLEQEIDALNNYELIFKNLLTIKNILSEYNIVGNLYEIQKALEDLSKYDSTYKNYADSVKNTYFEIEDLESEISSKYNHLEFDEDRLDQINERVNFLKNLMRKYNMDILDLISYQKKLETDIDKYEQFDYYIDKAKNELLLSFEKLVVAANKLTAIRKENATTLEKNIKETLKDLCLDKVQIDIRFEKVPLDDQFNSAPFKNNGVDNIEFFISFNVGEPLKELRKVASGGEMSRVMLALKTHLLKNMQLSTIIFDEIDTGISGEVAKAVAEKMLEISIDTQVLAITHLPVVAAAANQHLYLTKEVVDNRTITKIKELDYNEHIKEIAKMTSAPIGDEKAMSLASDMVHHFEKNKK